MALKKVHENTAWIHLGQHRDNRSAQVNMAIKRLASQTARNLLEQMSDDQFLKDFGPRGYLLLVTLSQSQRVRHNYSAFPMQFFYRGADKFLDRLGRIQAKATKL